MKNWLKKMKIERKDGRIYFTKELERRGFFYLTLLILTLGLLNKMGLL